MNRNRQQAYTQMLNGFLHGGQNNHDGGGANLYETPRLSDDELIAELNRLSRSARPFGAATGLCVAAAVILFFVFPFVMPFIFIAGIVFVFRLTKINREKKRLFSDNIVRGALDEVMKVEAFIHGTHVSTEQVKAADLVHGWNTFSGSDFVQADYKGVKLVFSDLHLVEVRKSGKTTKRITKFKGQWLICELNKPIERQVRLRERESEKGGFFSSKVMKSDVETENMAFNQKFQILTNDPHTAFLILTPHFMDYIVNIDNRAAARTYACFTQSCGKSYVHFAFHNNRDLFELNAKEKIDRGTLPLLRERIRREIGYVTGTVDELLRNEYLFKGET